MPDKFKELSSWLHVDQTWEWNTCKWHCLENNPKKAKVCRKIKSWEESLWCQNYNRASEIIKSKAEKALSNK